MSTPVKQHVIDPEICIRCYTCEEACPADAITHNDDNVVVDFSKCGFCMDCIAPCPTGSIDNWRVVDKPYTVEEQFEWLDLPEQAEFSNPDQGGDVEALDSEVEKLLAAAHAGAGGKSKAPASASKPSINLFNLGNPAIATVQGNYRLTKDDADNDVRHIILDLGSNRFPVLEGQSVGITPPGTDENGNPYLPRLYSVSSPRDGERPNTNNLSLTVKREPHGVCSNFVCDLQKGDEVKLTGPFGATFLMPDDPQANLLMICTGTGSAPFRAFTMRRQRTSPESSASMTLFFGARTPDSLPYFGPLNKIPDNVLHKELVFSRLEGKDKEYVQDRMIANAERIADLLKSENTYIYVCGLKEMEEGVEDAFETIASSSGINWSDIRDDLRDQGRYHVETY
ncbi:benzoyl-CoA 2,3-epoxidase subunit BoxA [Sneathiella sp. P13V-1]|uniref:benzoyl-CoA 2,3-epoxidase subunit BoxA n=1 Tax=Sneathiella sp. P13V-1 TaxID=2697366 RepID=UPI00187BA611|nr:benzoyl-CoA 2,3-epoxidase subunit BoxA [Sneathiella sp. P13V-1]MBE7637463.1 benzoyl-CoA 2,3-epoxidase subunit BoxA [Sneathiella sp. P13V-1]